MSKHFLQNLWAERIGGTGYGTQTHLYKFEKIKQAEEKARKENPGQILLDMGIGEPSEPPHPSIRQALQQEANNPSVHNYADNGSIAFNKAASLFMKRVYQVDLDPITDICHCIGIKSALSMLPLCFINPGDVTLTTTPGYPVGATHTQYLGGIIYPLPLKKEHDFLPDLDTIPSKVLQKAKLLILNYPNSPTGAQATLEFYQKVIGFAKSNKLIVIQDAAYGPFVYNAKPLSILSTRGAEEVAVELHSLSKMYNMTGWRIGWVCGHPEVIKAYKTIKENTDSGQFLAIQHAAIVALKQPEIIEAQRLEYEKRMHTLVDTLTHLGLHAKPSKGSFFVYVASPSKAICKQTGASIHFDSAEALSHWLIEKHLISTVPWDDVAPAIRFSLTYKASESYNPIEMLYDRLSRFDYAYLPSQ